MYSKTFHPNSHLFDLFPRPGLSFILGTFASKKTWLALDLAVNVATGRGWLGFQAPATPTFFVDYDHGLSELRRRLRSVLMAHHTSPDAPLHFTSSGGLAPHHERELASVASMAQTVSPGLILLDNPAFLPSYVQKRTEKGWDLHPAISGLRVLAERTNSAVVVLSHTRSRRTALGPLLVALGVDHVLGVDSPFGASWLHLRTLASRGLPPASITAELLLRQPRFGKIIYDAEFVHLRPSAQRSSPPLGKAAFAALGYLALKGPSSARSISANLPVAVPTRSVTLIHELIHEGYIQRINPGGKGSKALYALTPAGSVLI